MRPLKNVPVRLYRTADEQTDCFILLACITLFSGRCLMGGASQHILSGAPAAGRQRRLNPLFPAFAQGRGLARGRRFLVCSEQPPAQR